MKKIGFIGIGVMGKHMAKNLIKSGFEVSVYTRTKSKAQDLIKKGAVWCEDIQSCVLNKDVIITMIGYPKDVEDVYLKDNGILATAVKGQYIIDMTTSDPTLAEKIYECAKEKGVYSLDAPVSGGDVGAEKGTLSIMVGGDKEAFNNCQDVFKAMGTNIIYEGSAGKGQHTKMTNQIAIAGAVAGVVEAFAYGIDKGLNLETMFNSINQGAARGFQMSYNGEKILNNDNVAGFYLKHFVKDMTIASTQSKKDGLELEVLEKVLSIYKKLEKNGLGELGTQALIEYYK